MNETQSKLIGPILTHTKHNEDEPYFYKIEDDDIGYYRYAKPLNFEHAFVYTSEGWNIIDREGRSSIFREDNQKEWSFFKTIFKTIVPQNKFFLKNYFFNEMIIVSVNPNMLFNLLSNDFKKYSTYFESYKDISSGILILNLTNEEYSFSFVEDITLPIDQLVGVKHFNKLWGYISEESFKNNKLQDFVINQQFEYACSHINGLAKVKINGLFGFINKTGQFVIPAIYDDARSFSEGYAAVAISNYRRNTSNATKYYRYELRWNFIDQNNKPLLENTLSGLTSLLNGNYYYLTNDNPQKYGCKNIFGNDIIDDQLFSIYQEFEFIHFIRGFSPVTPFTANFCELYSIGQLHPIFLLKFLKYQMRLIDNTVTSDLFYEDECNIHRMLGNRLWDLTINDNNFDFDISQMTMDIISSQSSLFIKYGNKYLEYRDRVCKEIDQEKLREKNNNLNNYWKSAEEFGRDELREMTKDHPEWLWNTD